MKEYPIELYLTDKTKISVRPIESYENDLIGNFYARVPNGDFLVYKDDDNDSEEISFRIDEDTDDIQLGAFLQNKIIAKGTLHSEGLYLSNAAEIKLIVDPCYRNRGLGSQIFNLLLFEGLSLGYKKIIIRYSSENHHITKILNHYGFYPETMLNFYIEDKKTKQKKDLIIASFDLENWQRRFEFYNVINKT